MAIEMQSETGTFKIKAGLAQMLKGGVIMDLSLIHISEPTRPY